MSQDPYYERGECRCHHIPKEGSFQIGNIYEWTPCIDGTVVYDDNGNDAAFGEIEFLWYFTKTKDFYIE